MVMRDVLKRVNLKPAPSDIQKDAAPDKLKDQGRIELEKNAYDWNDDAQSVALDEVVMGNVLKKAGWKRSDLVISTKILQGHSIPTSIVSCAGDYAVDSVL